MHIQRKSLADVLMTAFVLTALGFIGLPRQAEAAFFANCAELQNGLVAGDFNGMLIALVVVLIAVLVSIVLFGIRRGRLA